MSPLSLCLLHWLTRDESFGSQKWWGLKERVVWATHVRLTFRFVLDSRRQRGDERNTPSCLSFSRPDGLSLWVIDLEAGWPLCLLFRTRRFLDWSRRLSIWCVGDFEGPRKSMTTIDCIYGACKRLRSWWKSKSILDLGQILFLREQILRNGGFEIWWGFCWFGVLEDHISVVDGYSYWFIGCGMQSRGLGLSSSVCSWLCSLKPLKRDHQRRWVLPS